MKLSVYGSKRRKRRSRKPRGHKRGCRCVVCKGRRRSKGGHRRRKTTHRRRRTTHRRSRKSGGRRLGSAARKASRICRGLLRRGKIHKLGPCYRSELRAMLKK